MKHISSWFNPDYQIAIIAIGVIFIHVLVFSKIRYKWTAFCFVVFFITNSILLEDMEAISCFLYGDELMRENLQPTMETLQGTGVFAFPTLIILFLYKADQMFVSIFKKILLAILSLLGILLVLKFPLIIELFTYRAPNFNKESVTLIVASHYFNWTYIFRPILMEPLMTKQKWLKRTFGNMRNCRSRYEEMGIDSDDKRKAYAYKLYEKIYSKGGRAEEHYYMLALLDFSYGFYEESRTNFNKVINLLQNRILNKEQKKLLELAHAKLGEIFADQLNLDEAIKYYTKASTLTSDSSKYIEELRDLKKMNRLRYFPWVQ